MPLTYVTAEEFAKQKTASGPSNSNRKYKHEKNFVYKSPSKVLSGLYVGNFRDSKDSTQLDRFNITHIVAIHDAARKLHPDKHYLCVMASDTPDQNLTQYFPICNDFIHAARLRGGNVLIHCLAGMSRSVTVAVAYIMSVTSLNWKEALKVVRVGRTVANPNSGFQQQLEDFEMTKLYDERRRLKERFPSLALAATDEAECHLILQSYEGLLLSRNLCEGNCAMGEVCPTGLCRSPSKTRGTGRRRSSAQTPPGSPGGRRLPATPILGRHQLSRSPSSLSSAPNSPLGERRSRTAYSAPPSRSGSRVDLLDPPMAPMSPLTIPRLTSLSSLMPASAPVSPRGSPAHLSRRP